MKHLIKTADQSGLASVNYNSVILNTITDNVTIDYPYVDLGLPSGVKWAKYNIGATSETDYGDYFMWGSTTPNTTSQCTWSNAPFNNGLDSYNEEYFNAHKSEWLDDNNNLKPEYDAARANMGGDWRMPTKDELKELLDNTDKLWTTINGVNGYKFTSNKEGYQNNSIFIPAAGYCDDGSVSNVGYGGYVWSSSLGTSSPNGAWYLYFHSDGCYMNNYYRYYGQSVRGVRK